MKIVSVYPGNVEKGLPAVPATMIVLDPFTGIVKASLDGTYLTQLRTGAVQGAATELLARKDAKIGSVATTSQGYTSAKYFAIRADEQRYYGIK